MLVAYTNDAFERSGAFVTLRIVGVELVEYEGAAHSDQIQMHLLDPQDGHLDVVHELRDALGADIVAFVHQWDEGPARYGGGTIMISPGYRDGWILSLSTFAHEVGHSFSLAHDRQDGLIGLRFGYGFDTSGCESTIMSYAWRCLEAGFVSSSTRIPFFSSPWRYSARDGHALGVHRFSAEMGPRGPADAVLTINRRRHGVAGRRRSRQEGE